jgi:hypothetical protein
MTEVSNFAMKPDPVACGCGCGTVGPLRARPWRDGVVCVKRGCVCPRCRGKRSRKKGDDKARQARKALGIPGANTRHEEHLGGGVRWEAKAGAQVRPMWTAFLRAEAQSEAARPVGDNRRFVMTAAADGTRDQLVVFRLADLRDVVAALAGQLWEAS